MTKVFAFSAAILLTATVWAQSPEKMNYQAVIRNMGGELITTQIGMKLSILQGADTNSATEVYIPRYIQLPQMPTDW